jgi:hypothetical protein
MRLKYEPPLGKIDQCGARTCRKCQQRCGRVYRKRACRLRTPRPYRSGKSYRKRFSISKLSGNGVYFTACSLLTLLKNRVVNFIVRKVLIQLSFYIRSRRLPSGCRVYVSWSRVQGGEFRVQGSGFRVQGSGLRMQGSGFRVQGSGCRVACVNYVHA